jgi:serine/threonine protein kinase
MAELHHPNLVRLFDLGQHEGRWFFTRELVHGQDLVEVLRQEDAAGGETSAAAVVSKALAETVVGDGAARGASGEDVPAPRRRHIACDPDALIRIVVQILDARPVSRKACASAPLPVSLPFSYRPALARTPTVNV